MDAQSIQVQALITFVMPLLIQLAKRSRSAAFAWIDQNKPKICLLTSGVTALLTSMGIEFVHSPQSLTVSWPDGATLVRGFATFLVAAVLQFAAQHALYDGFWRHVVPSAGARSPKSASGDPVIG
jgi:hypothetical protein